MNNSMISAMVSMNGIQKRLDVISNNIANLDNTGYKRQEASFEDTLTRVKQQISKMDLPGRATPLGFDMGFGARVTSITSNFAQGSIKESDNPTDFAIEGNALFAVLTPEGKAYTRGGDFSIQPDPNDPESSYLVTKLGHYVLNAGGDRIAVPSGAKLQVDPQGNISAVTEAGATALGRFQLKTPLRPDALESVDGNLYALAAGAIEDNVLEDTTNQATLRQGALESSNVNMADEMAEMMQVQRAYQLAARALTSSETMMGLANNLRG